MNRLWLQVPKFVSMLMVLTIQLVIADFAVGSDKYGRRQSSPSDCDEIVRFDPQVYRDNRSQFPLFDFDRLAIPMSEDGDRATFFETRLNTSEAGLARVSLPKEKIPDLARAGLLIVPFKEMLKDRSKFEGIYGIHRELGLIQLVSFKPTSEEIDRAGLVMVEMQLIRGFKESSLSQRVVRTVPRNSLFIAATNLIGESSKSIALSTLSPLMNQLTRDHRNILERSLIDGFLFLRSNKGLATSGMKSRLIGLLRQQLGDVSRLTDDEILDLVIKNIKYSVGGIKHADSKLNEAVRAFVKAARKQFNLDFFKLSITAKVFADRHFFHDIYSDRPDVFQGGTYSYEIVGSLSKWIYDYGFSHILSYEDRHELDAPSRPSYFETRDQLLSWLKEQDVELTIWPYLFDRDSILNSVVNHHVEFEPRDTQHAFDWGHLGAEISTVWKRRYPKIHVADHRGDFFHQISPVPKELPSDDQTGLVYQLFRRKPFGLLQRFARNGKLMRDMIQPRGENQYLLIISDDYHPHLHHLLRVQAFAYGYEDVLWTKK